MAISFRSASTVAGNNTTVNAPTGIVSGDMLIACVYTEVASGTWTPPSGWTLLDAQVDTGSTAWLHTYYKVATASEPSTYTWTQPAGGWTSIRIVCFNSGGATLSIDQHGASNSASNSASPNVTTTASGDAVIIFGANYNGASNTSPGSPWTLTPTSSYAWFTSGYQIQTSAGTIGAFTFESTAYGLGATVAIQAGGGTVSSGAIDLGSAASGLSPTAIQTQPDTLQTGDNTGGIAPVSALSLVICPPVNFGTSVGQSGGLDNGHLGQSIVYVIAAPIDTGSSASGGLWVAIVSYVLSGVLDMGSNPSGASLGAIQSMMSTLVAGGNGGGIAVAAILSVSSGTIELGELGNADSPNSGIAPILAGIGYPAGSWHVVQVWIWRNVGGVPQWTTCPVYEWRSVNGVKQWVALTF